MPVALSIFRVLAACTSTLMILSPIPTIYRIVRAGVVGHHSIVPLVSMLANCHMNLLYGYLVHNIFPIFATFLFGDILSVIYIALFYRFTDDRPTAHKAMALSFGPLALVTLYAVCGPYWLGQTREQVGQIIGYLGIVSTVVLYSAPFEKVALVLRHRSAVFLNMHMVVTGTITNSTWVTYSALAQDWIVFAPNVVTVVAGLVQIALYLVYNPGTHPLRDETDLKGDADAKDIELATDSPTHGGDYGGTIPTPHPLGPLHFD